MNYAIIIFKKQGEPLYALWIDTLDVKPQSGTLWQMVRTVEIATEEPIPAALCGQLLMSETTSDKLFRQISDTWIGPLLADPLDNYDEYASQEEIQSSVVTSE